jgi:hypothetical protein
MSARKILRIVLILVVLYLLWTRAAYLSRGLLISCIVISIFLLGAVFYQLFTSMRKRPSPRDEVPKHPLGLDS